MYVQQPQMYTSTTSSTSHVLPTDSTLYQQNLINALSSPAPVSIPAPLDSDQLSDLVSTMIYIMWNLRRSSVMAIHTASMQGGNRDIIYSHPIQQGETALIVNGVDKAFKRFCHQILVVTQLSESVVILSLKYIAILLQNNPRIQGADGSEYRLFIVALLLANKFHDDNTYTNKTWSDISRMEISELNIMEFEFLDVLRYRLFVQKEEYDQWKMGLLSFMTQLKNVALLQEEKLMQSTIRNISMALQQQQQQFIPLSSSSSSSITSPCSSLLTTTATATNDSHNHSLTPEQHYLYLLSKTQQPILPQPPHSPLTRVPLRIPIHPVYTITPIPSTHTTPMMIYSQPPFITPSTSTTSVNNNSNNNNNNLIPLTSASFNSNPMDFSTSSSYPLPLTSQPSSIVTTFPTTAIISPSSHVKPDHQHHYNHHYHHRFQPYQRSHHSSPMDSPSNNALKKDHQKKSRLRAQSNPTSFVSQPYDTTYFKQLYP